MQTTLDQPADTDTDTATLVTIDPEFASLCPPLTPAERGQLEENIKADGCREPLVTWKGLLLDGHNRHTICTRLGIAFTIRRVTLDDRDAAVNWIIANQLGRRNITPEQASYLRGKRYNREKKPVGGNQYKEPIVTNARSSSVASERLAEEYKVNESSIRKDGKFATAIDTIAEAHGESVKQEILQRDSRIPKIAVIEAAKAPKEKQLEVLKKPRAKPSTDGMAALERNVGNRKADVAVRRIIDVLAGLTSGFDTLSPKDAKPTADEVAAWETDLSRAVSAINKFRRQLKEYGHE